MSYHSESFETRGQRGGRLQDDSRAYRDDVEEEPTDLDAPASDGLDDDELEDVKILAEELDDEGDAEDDDKEEAASPLAEDAPIEASEETEEDADGVEAAETEEQEESALDETPGVRHSGRRDVSVMSHGERRREFPAHKPASKHAKPGKRRARRTKVRVAS